VKRVALFSAVAFLLLLAPNSALAKGKTLKITIDGGNLRNTIEIKSPRVLAPFRVWSGPGTSAYPSIDHAAPSFIVDWSQGALRNHPENLPLYKISFWADSPKPRVVYVVFYEYDPAVKQGYVYLPGQNDEWFALNIATIMRDVEGKWFRSWSAWDQVASPLLSDPRLTAQN